MMTAVYPLSTALLVRLRGLRCSLRKGDYRLHSAKPIGLRQDLAAHYRGPCFGHMGQLGRAILPD